MELDDDIDVVEKEEVLEEKEAETRLSQGDDRKIRVDSKVVTPIVKPRKIKGESPIFIAEQMPRFPGCEDIGGSHKEKYECAQSKLLAFIYKHIRYPKIAIENGIEGNVAAQFVVETNGTISNVRVIKDIGGGCGRETLRVANLINEKGIKWEPGRQRGRAVRVMFTLPVRFELK